MPQSDKTGAFPGKEHDKLVGRLARDGRQQRGQEEEARRAWEASEPVREIEHQLALFLEYAAGYAGSQVYPLGRHIDEARDHVDAVSRYEPQTVYLERTGLGQRDWSGSEGFCQQFAAREFCERWVRDYWVQTVPLLRECGYGKGDLQAILPTTGIQTVVKDLYLRLFEDDEPSAALIREIAEQLFRDRARLGDQARSLHQYFELLAGCFRPLTWPEFLESWEREPGKPAPARDLLITWLQITRVLMIDGAPWLSKAKRQRPEPVHASPARSGNSSLYRVGDLLPVIEAVSGKQFDLSTIENALRKVAKSPDHVPEWSENH